jgi:hypothetical protein
MPGWRQVLRPAGTFRPRMRQQVPTRGGSAVGTCAAQNVFWRLAQTSFHFWPDSLYTNDIINRLKAGP